MQTRNTASNYAKIRAARDLPLGFERIKDASDRLNTAMRHFAKIENRLAYNDDGSRDIYSSQEVLAAEQHREDESANFDKIFKSIFIEEMEAGNFAILLKHERWDYLSSLEIAPLLEKILLKEESCEKILLAFKKEPVALSHLVANFGEMLSTELLLLAWTTFKSSLDSSFEGWLSENELSLKGTFSFKSEDAHTPVGVPWGIVSSAEAFFEADQRGSQGSEAMLSEVSFLMQAYETSYLLGLYGHHTRNPKLINHYEFKLRLQAAPSIVMLLNPTFFKSEIDSRGVDRTVVEMLLPSWRGNFESLLDSAQSLSSECFDFNSVAAL